MPLLTTFFLVLLAFFLLSVFIEIRARKHQREPAIRLSIALAIAASLALTCLGAELSLASLCGDAPLKWENLAGPVLLLFNGMALWIILKKPTPILSAADLHPPPSLLACLFRMNFYLTFGVGRLAEPEILPQGNLISYSSSFVFMTALVTLIWVAGTLILVFRRHRSLRKEHILIPMIGKLILLLLVVAGVQAIFMSQQAFPELQESSRQASSLGEGLALFLLGLSELRLVKEIGWKLPAPSQNLAPCDPPM